MLSRVWCWVSLVMTAGDLQAVRRRNKKRKMAAIENKKQAGTPAYPDNE